MSILPIALNQFAIDKGGLTLRPALATERSRVSRREGGRQRAHWRTALALLPRCRLSRPARNPDAGVVGSNAGGASLGVCLVAPAAAIFSALFPRVVDLNSIGRASNAHGLSALLGMLTFVAAAAVTAAIAGAATSWFRSAGVTLLILTAWCAMCFVIGRLLFVPTCRIFARRRDNLGML